MADSSDNDDLPDLVESSDEDSPAEKKARKTNADLASSWLTKGSIFLEKQELWMRVFCLCPFLYGVNNIVSAPWIRALLTAKLLLNEKRQFEVTYFEWQEWECVDLMDHIISIVQEKMRTQEVLCRCLDCVEVLENCKTGVIIDAELAIQEAKKYEEVSDIWTTVLKDQVCNGKEVAAKFGVLYVIKLYHCHVISIEVNGKDFVEEKKREYKIIPASKKAEECKKNGNTFYSGAQYEDSINCYTYAIKVDPFHHIYYGNRAQAYNKLEKYKEVLADGRRAITIKPDFPKGHYRYGQAFFKLGQLESAIKVNKQGLQLCEKLKSSDYANVKELQEQGEKFLQARQEGTRLHQPLTCIPKDLEKKLDSIAATPEDLNKKFGIEEPPMLVSSDSDSDSPPPSTGTRSRKKSKSKAQKQEKLKQDKQERTKQEKPKEFKVSEKAAKINALLKTPDIGPGSLYGHTAKRFGQEPDSEIGLQIQQSHSNQVNRMKFQTLLTEGSEALLKKVNKVAYTNFKTALDVIALAADIDIFAIDSSDVLTLKYAFGMAAISTGIYKNILEGVDRFNEILKVSVRYPMAYYGLGKAYFNMNRFHLALQKLQEGQSLVERMDNGLGINTNCEYWPGTNELIEESNLNSLKIFLGDLIQLCHFSPPPDGVCRHHTDNTDSRTDIYRSDPDFKGLYQIVCEMGCAVSFHTNCWKDFKTERNISIDKDILDTICVTPDCSGSVIKIIIERDLDTKREFISEKYAARVKQTREKKPVVKMKSTRVTGISLPMDKSEDNVLLTAGSDNEKDPSEGLFTADEVLAHQIPEIVELDGDRYMELGIEDSEVEDVSPASPGTQSLDHKLAKKKDKKDLRKQRRRERMEEKDDLEEDSHKSPQQQQLNHVTEMTENYLTEATEVLEKGTRSPHPLPNEKETVVLKKEDITETKVPGKQKRNRKKKDKSKQLLNLEVNFSDRKEETLLGENSVFSDEEEKEKPKSEPAPEKPGSVSTPSAGQKPVKLVENFHTFPDQSSPRVDDVTENLLSYFADILKVNGPLAIDDTKIQQEIEVFPHEAQEKIKSAGGLGEFLKLNFKFAVIDDVVSLMTDAVKAREIALMRRHERISQGKQPQAQDAWKTVGKGSDVDSLKESVTNLNSESIGKASYVSVASDYPNKYMFSPGTLSKDVSRSPFSHDGSGKATASLANSNSSNSVSSMDSSTSQVRQFSDKSNFKQSEASIDDFQPKEFHEITNGLRMNTLDSIDDFPLPKVMSSNEIKSKLDDLDDFDIDPDTSISFVGKGIKKSKKGKVKVPADAARSQTFIGDSASDISETSDISVEGPKLVVVSTTKPLKSLNRFGPIFTSAINTEHDSYPVASVDSEIKRLADDFIEKTDEKFMSEIADSVVEQIYSGKSVSDVERANTLKQVSADIRKDFEKSAKSGSLMGSGIWADTPASADYSKNIGKFATDFMKSHYQKENIMFSPTSDPSTLITHNSVSPDDSNFRINSPLNMTSEIGSDTRSSFSSSFISPSTNFVYTSDYNLFSGPSLGLDSLSSPRSSSPQFPRSSQMLIRPPPAAATYYSTIPPPASLGSQTRPHLTPLRVPSVHTVLKADKETQVVCATYTSVETMTESFDMVDLQMYLQVKDECERIMRETARSKERISADLQKLEARNKEQDMQIAANQKQFEAEKKNWSKEKESLHEVIKSLREQLANKQKSEAELKQIIATGETKLSELTTWSNAQRENDMLEMKRLVEEAKQHRQNWEQQRERAKNAEIEILKLKLTAANKMLERSQKEAAFHVKNLEGFIKKHKDDSKAVPVQFKQCQNHWKSVAEKCVEILANVKNEYESQIAEISSGKMLSELSPITIPSPPPIPDAIKSFMMNPHQNNMPEKMPLTLPSPGQPHSFGIRPPPPTNIVTGNVARFPTPSMVAGVRPEYSLSTATTGPSVTQPQTVQPRPLQAAAGVVPPRPLSGARPPLVTPIRPSVGATGMNPASLQVPKTSFEKLILKLQIDFPSHNRNEFNHYIQTLRQKRGGSLSGMSMQDIITQVSEMLTEKDRQVTKGAESSGKPLAPPPGLSSSWAFPRSSTNNNSSGGSMEMFQEDEDPCAICHEDLSSGSVNTLECTHKFHDVCIRKWFREQSTCPNCRVHSLLSDEFPSLG